MDRWIDWMPRDVGLDNMCDESMTFLWIFGLLFLWQALSVYRSPATNIV